MENIVLERYYNEILSYIGKNENNVSKTNAKEVIDSFKEEWVNSIDYMFIGKDIGEKYGEALIVYSAGVFELETLSTVEVELLSERIKFFDENESVKYKLGIKTALFINVALCWHRLGDKYKKNIIDSIKKYIYYSICISYNTSYSPSAYKFRTCNKYFFQSLINESIGLTSPGYFNDPFDSPIRELLNNDEDFSQYIRQAYNEGLKVSCFSSNIKLPREETHTHQVINNKEKLKGALPEYLNELMWAHYADSHKGVCIKYHFPNSFTKFVDNSDGVTCFFNDVTYSDSDISQYSNKDSINMKDAFFLKGKQWEYENELRLLYFDVNGREGYKVIKAENCIEAVYFGLRCSEEDKTTIMNILKDKKLITIDFREKQTESPIKFYQMEVDKEHFGQVKAKEITPEIVCSTKEKKSGCWLLKLINKLICVVTGNNL
ncbi:DUF2971 domain-containing protein [Prevotella intermedia]|uniref:DUF2971 domain-containing protein n=1 Tax=Prevotella intermedia TaxID=28131 RepID=A0A2G9IFD3_PREIN|nr:DUF2971 domain-containing protein [Prevotella intermedia]PIN28455.1 hypothetical protein CUC04_03000 [Prevotella intermedia]